LLWVVAVHLVFLPWAIGGMRPWSQWISLVLSIAGMIVALLPRAYTAEHTGWSAYRMLPAAKLLRFPIFWLGLAMLTLVTIQALNPAWEYHNDGKTWWMQRIPNIAWLPASVRVPFAKWGPWRQLIIYSSAFLAVCSIWIGFTRRRTVQRLFIILAANGIALSALGLAQRVTGTNKIFWIRESENVSFFGSFVYKNHAGAYLDLMLAIACGLGGWYYVRGLRRLEKSNPSGVFAFFATCIAASVLVSYARGATFVMLIYLCLLVGIFIVHQWRLPAASRRPIIAIAMILLFGYFLKTGLEALQSDIAWDRLKQAVSGQDLSVHSREVADQASFDMLRANWKMGTGSGSFEFLYPIYEQHYPEITTVLWRHAHNDVLELPIELGIAGVLIVLGGFAYWTLALIRNFSWQNPLSGAVLLGCLGVLGMSWGDFVFQNPAILITWCSLWPASTLWARLEEQRGRA
jgi:hypothetical protein